MRATWLLPLLALAAGCGGEGASADETVMTDLGGDPTYDAEATAPAVDAAEPANALANAASPALPAAEEPGNGQEEAPAAEEEGDAAD